MTFFTDLDGLIIINQLKIMDSVKKPIDSITIGHAKAWTKNWQKLFPNHAKAFLIPIPDVIEILIKIGVLVENGSGGFKKGSTNHADLGVRAYMALGDFDKDGDLEERLVLVGAKKDFKGTFLDQVADRKDSLKLVSSGSGAFDVTRPCPNECDPKSSLYHNS